MDKVNIVKKGYTIEVTSWENDGDNYKTKTMTVDDKEYALALLQMCKDLFGSCNNGDGGIGNIGNIGNIVEDEYLDGKDIILNYVGDKHLITKGETEPDVLVDIVMDINHELMGSCEYYYSRVFDSGFIFYSPVDVSVKKIAELNRFK